MYDKIWTSYFLLFLVSEIPKYLRLVYSPLKFEQYIWKEKIQKKKKTMLWGPYRLEFTYVIHVMVWKSYITWMNVSAISTNRSHIMPLQKIRTNTQSLLIWYDTEIEVRRDFGISLPRHVSYFQVMLVRPIWILVFSPCEKCNNKAKTKLKCFPQEAWVINCFWKITVKICYCTVTWLESLNQLKVNFFLDKIIKVTWLEAGWAWIWLIRQEVRLELFIFVRMNNQKLFNFLEIACPV